MFGATGDLVTLDFGLLERSLQRFAKLRNQLLTLATFRLHQFRNALVIFRFEELESQVLEFGFDSCHSEAMRERGIDLTRFEGNSLLLVLREMLESSHVVKTIGELHHYHAGVPRNRQQELSVVLRLFLSRRSEGQGGDLCEAVHQSGHLSAKLSLYLIESDIGVLDHIMQQCGGDSNRVELLVHQNRGNRHSVRQVVFTRKTLLASMGRFAKLQGALDQLQVERIPSPAHSFSKSRVNVSNGGGQSSPASAKLKYLLPPTTT